MNAKTKYQNGEYNNLQYTDRQGEQNHEGTEALARDGVTRVLMTGNAGFYPVFYSQGGQEIWKEITTPLYMAVS